MRNITERLSDVNIEFFSLFGPTANYFSKWFVRICYEEGKNFLQYILIMMTLKFT